MARPKKKTQPEISKIEKDLDTLETQETQETQRRDNSLEDLLNESLDINSIPIEDLPFFSDPQIERNSTNIRIARLQLKEMRETNKSNKIVL